MRRLVAGVVMMGVVGVAACGGSASASSATIKPLKISALEGGQLLGLRVSDETANVKALKGAKRPYVDSIGIFGLRNGDLLEATLQVSRFTKKAAVGSSRFRTAVFDQIGSTVPQEFRMGSERVFLTTGKRQTIAMWFRGRYLFILSTRDEYTQPRTLLRNALVINP